MVRVWSLIVWVMAGFGVIQWWASLGLVAGHWTAGENQEAELYYTNIEGMLDDR